MDSNEKEVQMEWLKFIRDCNPFYVYVDFMKHMIELAMIGYANLMQGSLKYMIH